MKTHNRRHFLKTAMLSGMATIALPKIVSAAWEYETLSKIKIKQGQTILFQGDSITDAGRNHNDNSPNSPSAMGSGYVFLAAAGLLHTHASKSLCIYNKGVSGNKVYQLVDRWQDDCIALKPDVLSMLVGVNDFWHTLSFGYNATVETYENDYRKLLTATKQAFPAISFVIGEPFAIKDTSVVNNDWFPAFDAYRATAKKLADEFGAIFIPYQSIFDEAQKFASGAYWAYDGVHPTLAGAHLMAEAWQKIIE